MHTESFRTIHYNDKTLLDDETKLIVGDYNRYMEILKMLQYSPDNIVEITQGVIRCMSYIIGIGHQACYKKWLSEAVYDFFIICKEAILSMTESAEISAAFDAILLNEEIVEANMMLTVTKHAASFVAFTGFDTLGDTIQAEYRTQAKEHYKEHAVRIHKENEHSFVLIQNAFTAMQRKFQEHCTQHIEYERLMFIETVKAINPRLLTNEDRRSLIESCMEMQVDPSIIPPKPSRTASDWVEDVLKHHLSSSSKLLAIEPPSNWHTYISHQFDLIANEEDADQELKTLRKTLPESEKTYIIEILSPSIQQYYTQNRTRQLQLLHTKIEENFEHFFKVCPAILSLNTEKSEWMTTLSTLLTQLVESADPSEEMVDLFHYATPAQQLDALTSVAERAWALYEESRTQHKASYQEEITELLKTELQANDRILQIPGASGLIVWAQTTLHTSLSDLDENAYLRACHEYMPMSERAELLQNFLATEGVELFEVCRELKMEGFKQIVLVGMADQFAGMQDDVTFFEATGAIGDAWLAVIEEQVRIRMDTLADTVPLKELYEDLNLPHNQELKHRMFLETLDPLKEESDVLRQKRLEQLSAKLGTAQNLRLLNAVMEEALSLDMPAVQQTKQVALCLQETLEERRPVLEQLHPREGAALLTDVIRKQEPAFRALTAGAAGLLTGSSSQPVLALQFGKADAAGDAIPAGYLQIEESHDWDAK